MKISGAVKLRGWRGGYLFLRGGAWHTMRQGSPFKDRGAMRDLTNCYIETAPTSAL